MVSEAEFKINRAKIKLQSRNPFFAYLSLYMTTQEAKEGELPPYAIGGVSPKGIMKYNPEKIKELDDEQVITFLTHEILHLALLHLTRRGNREMVKWNIATDLVINTILKQNGFQNIEGSIISNYEDEFECKFAKGKQVIKEVSKKNAEMIYDEMPEIPEWLKNLFNSMSGEGEGGKGKKSFDDSGFSPKDSHIEERGGEGERTKDEEEWLKRLEEASQVAKSKGNIPNGMERYIDSLKKGKINWKSLLERYLQAQIPQDYTWNKKSKRSVACGCYLPDTLKEKIEVGVMIDLSGSVGKEELSEFIAEIIGLAKAYKSRIDMRLFTHDTEIHTDKRVENGNIEKIKKIKLKGGGGTSFIQPLKQLEDKRYKPQALIWLTDGFGDEINTKNKPRYPLIWVLCKNGDDSLIKNSGKVIKMVNYDY